MTNAVRVCRPPPLQCRCFAPPPIHPRRTPMNQYPQPSRRDFFHFSGAALLTALGTAAARAQKVPEVPTVDEAIRKLAEDAPLSMRFRGTTADECRKWQA